MGYRPPDPPPPSPGTSLPIKPPCDPRKLYGPEIDQAAFGADAFVAFVKIVFFVVAVALIAMCAWSN